jgi:hypothetical protein
MQVEHATRGVSGVLVASPTKRTAVAKLMTPAESLARRHYAGPGSRIERSTGQCGGSWSYVHPISSSTVVAATRSAR